MVGNMIVEPPAILLLDLDDLFCFFSVFLLNEEVFFIFTSGSSSEESSETTTGEDINIQI